MPTIQLLDKAVILRQLNPAANALFNDLIIFETIGSTNDYLLQKNNLASGYVCLAEQQTAGRGRRQGRQWISPFGRNIYLSLSWNFASAKQLTGLSLAVGVAVVDALYAYGLDQIQIKWPNDIVHKDQKLGGILIETSKSNAEHCQAIIGIGLNVATPIESSQQINQAWTDIQAIRGQVPDRNILVGALLNALLLALKVFQDQGLTPFKTRWQQLDALIGRPVTIHAFNGNQQGIAQGIDDMGFLLVDIDGIRHRLSSGEISVRLQQNT